jgi:ATP-dependent Lhr-like helicase
MRVPLQGREGTGPIAAAAACWARSRKGFSKQLDPGDTFLFAGKVVRYEGMRERGLCLARQRDRIRVPVLCRRQVSALDLSRRQVSRHARRSVALEGAARTGADWLRMQRRKSVLPRAAKPCWSRPFRAAALLHGRLCLRGPARPPDPRHAADPPAGARPRAAARASSPPTIRSRSGAGDIGALIRRALSLGELFDEDMLGDDLEPGSPNRP